MKMNLEYALVKLNLDNKYNKKNIIELTNIELKKSYHIMALNYHPDKNKEINAKERFQEIGEAYSFLYNIINSNVYNIYENNTEEEIYDTPYTDLMINLLKMLLTKQESGEINKFQKKCIEYTNKLFDQLFDKINLTVLEDIYEFIVKNSMGLSEDIINIIKNVINQKFMKYNMYIITASLENIINSEIFKLEIDEDIVYVPLWHQEMVYENILIKIRPILPDNITIDEYNNMHIKYNDKFINFLNLINQDIKFIEINNYKVYFDDLRFKKNQIILIKNKGIPLINTNDILDNKTKGDICIHIQLE
tara:strand:+ start:2340 stop:3257 length:918 start_codon:yes stop_codon:yes gene_type:complete